MSEEEKKIEEDNERVDEKEDKDFEDSDVEIESFITEEPLDFEEDEDLDISDEDLSDLLDEDDLEELKELTEELGLESGDSDFTDISPSAEVESAPKNESGLDNSAEEIIIDESNNEVKPEIIELKEEISQDSQDTLEDTVFENDGPPSIEHESPSSEVVDGDQVADTSPDESSTESAEEKSILAEFDLSSKSVKDLSERDVKKNVIEAAMFIAGRPVSIEELSVKLNLKKRETEELVYELAMNYLNRISAVEIVQIGDSYSLQIKAEYTNSVKRFASGGLIPEAVMRTLTVIALKQPLSKAKLVKMRGSGAYQHVKFLVDRGFLSSYKKGRSSILETTEQFSDQFGLSHDVKQLKQQLTEQLGIKSAEEVPAEQEGNNENSSGTVEESDQTGEQN
jgi:segregation and condensation protein B